MFLLDGTSGSSHARIYNIMLITSFHGKMLTMNFNSTKGDFEHVESALRRSVASVKVNEH